MESKQMKLNMNQILEDTGFLRLPEVLKLIPVSRASWWAGMKEGRYPKSVHLSERVTAWKVEDIRALIERINGQEAAA